MHGTDYEPLHKSPQNTVARGSWTSHSPGLAEEQNTIGTRNAKLQSGVAVVHKLTLSSSRTATIDEGLFAHNKRAQRKPRGTRNTNHALENGIGDIRIESKQARTFDQQLHNDTHTKSRISSNLEKRAFKAISLRMLA